MFPKLHQRNRGAGRSVSLSDLTRYTLCALLIFTPLARASVQDWAVAVIHMTTLFALATFLMNNIRTGEWRWIRTPLDQPILALLILAIVSTIFSSHRPTSFQAMMLLVNYLVIFYLTIHTVQTRSHLRQVIYVMMGMAAFLSLFGWFKLFGANPFPWWDYADLSQNADRMTATFGNPDHLAGYMEMALLLISGLTFTGFRYLKSSVMICLIFFMIVSLLLSLSRGAWIGAFAGFSLMLTILTTNHYFKKRRRIAAVCGGVLIVMLIILSNTPVVERLLTFKQKADMPSFSGRVLVWGGIVDMIQDYPLIGAGPGTFATIFTQYQPPGQKAHYSMGHNDYLHSTAEVGIPLIPIMVWMMIGFYKRGLHKLKNRSRLVRGATLGGMAGVTAILVHGIGDFNLHIPANALLFTVIAALTMAPQPRSGRTRQPSHHEPRMNADGLCAEVHPRFVSRQAVHHRIQMQPECEDRHPADP